MFELTVPDLYYKYHPFFCPSTINQINLALQCDSLPNIGQETILTEVMKSLL